MINSAVFRASVLIVSGLLTGVGAYAQEPQARSILSPLERQGKQIYLRGESDSGAAVHAILGDPPMQVSAKMLPCVNCHGYDGGGIPEGGLTPSNIVWSALTKRYGTIHATGRRHGPYDEDSLKRALTMGIDPSQNTLGVGMPKYRMIDSDLESLIAYLKRIEDDRDPGVTESTVTLATILPLEGPQAHLGREIRDVLNARLEDLNNEGGIYNRKIELRVVGAVGTPAEGIARLRALLDSEEIFALVAPLLPHGEALLAALADEREIPVIASLGRSPDNRDGPSRYLFYLSSAPSVQARALADRCVEQLVGVEQQTAALITRQGEPFEELSHAIAAQCRKRGIDLHVIAPYSADAFAPERLAWEQLQSRALFFIGPDADCARVLHEIGKMGQVPDVFLMGTFLGKQIFNCPRVFQGKLSAVFPNSPSSRTKSAATEYRAFLDRHKFSAPSSPARLAAYCATNVLFEALDASGRDLRREHLIRKLEGFWEYETGLSPPVTFGPNRRVGAYGAYVVSVDLEAQTFNQTDRWVEPLD